MPFTREQFLEVFGRYNEGVWPAQLGLVALALVVLVCVGRRTRRASSLAAAGLAVLWLWMAIAYHFVHFTAINPAAWVFGAAFVVQAVLFGVSAAIAGLSFGLRSTWTTYVGVGIVAYALIVYPWLGQLGDHAYPRSPTFGLPCPTTIFTFGLLLLTTEHVPKRLLVIPATWAGIASFAPVAFGMWEDLGLSVAALLTVVVLVLRDRAPGHATAAVSLRRDAA